MSPHSIHDFRDSRVSARVASASVAILEGLSRQYREASAVCALTRIQHQEPEGPFAAKKAMLSLTAREGEILYVTMNVIGAFSLDARSAEYIRWFGVLGPWPATSAFQWLTPGARRTIRSCR